MLCIVVLAAKTGEFLTSDLKGVRSTITNGRILVYIFCLISIGLPLSGEANKMKYLNVERAQL